MFEFVAVGEVDEKVSRCIENKAEVAEAGDAEDDGTGEETVKTAEIGKCFLDICKTIYGMI